MYFKKCLPALLVLLPAACYTASAQRPGGRSIQAHSHNDYEQDIPFWAAYNAGFGSIEADIWLEDGALLVAHDRKELALNRSLDQYYLQPLLSVLERHSGHPHTNPASPLQILIDIKSAAGPTLSALVSLLQKYPALTAETGIRFVISGNRPEPAKYRDYPPFIWFDGVLHQEYPEGALRRIALMSDDLPHYSHWNGSGGGTTEEVKNIKAAIGKAHAEGKPVRFWETPDYPAAWKQLAELDVDYLNTDNINQMADWLQANKPDSNATGVAGIAIPGAPLPAWQKGMLDLHHINTGRGNAAYFILPDGTTLLMDAGELNPSEPRTSSERNTRIRPNGSKHPYEWIADYIRSVSPAGGKTVIDYAVITHFHDDHFGGWYPGCPMSGGNKYALSGISGVASLVPVTVLLTRDYNYPAIPEQVMQSLPRSSAYVKGWENYRAFIHDRESAGRQDAFVRAGSATQIRLKESGAFPDFSIRNIKTNGQLWTGKDSSIRSLFPVPADQAHRETWPDENCLSNAFLIRYGPFRYYTGGDNPGNSFPGDKLNRDLETPIAAVVGPVDAATMDHHGNRDAVNENLVRTLHPRVWVEQVWTADHPGHETIIRATSPAYDPGPKDVFSTNLMESTHAVIGGLIDEYYKSTQGHVLIRVMPGGNTYYVIVLDDSRADRLVKKIFGPYRSGEKG